MSRGAAPGVAAALRHVAALLVATPRLLLVALVRAYQLLVSPLLGPTCRFYPSCSAYALEAVTVHGAVRGTYLAARRLARCHPWNPGGVDLVPGTASRHVLPPDPPADPPADAAEDAAEDVGAERRDDDAPAHGDRGADQTTADRADPHQRTAPRRAPAA